MTFSQFFEKKNEKPEHASPYKYSVIQIKMSQIRTLWRDIPWTQRIYIWSMYVSNDVGGSKNQKNCYKNDWQRVLCDVLVKIIYVTCAWEELVSEKKTYELSKFIIWWTALSFKKRALLWCCWTKTAKTLSKIFGSAEDCRCLQIPK